MPTDQLAPAHSDEPTQQEAADYDAWFRRQAQIGLDAANAGDLIPAAEVEAEAQTWRARSLDAWLHTQVGPAYDALKADPSSALTPEQVRAHLAAEHAKAR